MVRPLGKIFAKPEHERRADVGEALRAADAGFLTPRVHGIHPLEQAAQAHADTVGAVLLRTTPRPTRDANSPN